MTMQNGNVNGSQTNPVFKELSTQAEKHVIPLASRYDVVDVTINVSNNLMLHEVARIESLKTFVLDDVLVSEEVMFRYIVTLVKQRIDWVRGLRPQIRPEEKVAVPSIISVILENLGEVEDLGRGIKLIPVLEANYDGFMSSIEVFETSRKLRQLADKGYDFALGYAKSRSGSWDFMSIQVIENVILCGSRDVPPVYALLASILQLNSTLNTCILPRVSYGNTEYMQSIISRVLLS